MTERTVIFDTETTGLVQNSLLVDKYQPQIIEFFGVGIDGDSPDLQELEFFCNPGAPIPKKVTEITGITTDQLQGEPPFKVFAGQVKDLIEWADVVVAHNLSFDKTCVDLEMARIGEAVNWPDQLICTVEQTEHLKGHRLNLEGLHELLFEERFSGAHRARTDVQALSRCYFELVRRGEI